MRDTVILDDAYLGKYQHPGRLKPGDTQHMSFEPNDYGPFWMPEEKKERNNFDCELDNV